MKQFALLWVILSFITFDICAQDIRNSFGLNGETKNPISNPTAVTNNLFTGTASVTVPIISKTINGADLSVNLSYNTRGIKVDESSSNIGLGWSLNFGGVINREIRGIPDELFVNLTVPGWVNWNVLGYWHQNKAADIDYGDPETMRQMTSSLLDDQPDIFSVSFGGRTLSFMFGDNNTLIKIPENENIKIQRTDNGSIVTTVNKKYTALDLGFIITDELGNKYYFIPGDHMKSFCFQPTSGGTVTDMPINWVLEKFESYNGEIVSYSYIDSRPVVTRNYVGQSYGEFLQGNIEGLDCPFGKLFNYDNLYYGIYKMVKYINYNDVVVQFNYDQESSQTSTRWDVYGLKALQNITIKDRFDNSNPFSLRYNFYQSYFNSNTSSPAELSYSTTSYGSGSEHKELRLKLNKITLNDGNVDEPYYEFSYFDSERLPDRNSYKQDIWGYANQSTITYPNSSFQPGNAYPLWSGNIPTEYNDIHFPNFNNTQNMMGVDRNPTNSVAVRSAFSLKSIKNRFGGVKEFEYELPQAKIGNSVGAVDGLRLKKIRQVDDFKAGAYQETIYEYEDGQYFIPTANSFSFSTLFKTPLTYLYNYSTYYYTTDFNIISSIMTQSTCNGVLHGYSKVTATNYYVNNTLSVNSLISKTENYFSNVFNVPSGTNFYSSTLYGNPISSNTTDFILKRPPHTSSLFGYSANSYFTDFDKPPFSDKQYLMEWGIGLPWKTIEFVQNVPVVMVENFYDVKTRVFNTDEFISLHTSPWVISSYSPTSNLYYKDYFYPYSGHVELRETKKTQYLNNGSIINANSYSYDNRNNIKSIKGTNSLGQSTEDIYFYNYDFASQNSASVNQLTTDNVSQILYFENRKTINSVPHIVGATGYGVYTFNGKVRVKNRYQLSINNPLSLANVSGGIGMFDHNAASVNGSISNFRLIESYDSYDDKGNVLQLMKDGYTESYIYDKEENCKVAKIINGAASECAYTSFETPDLGGFAKSLNAVAVDYEHHTGEYSIYLGNGEWLKIPHTLVNGKHYLLSFWAKNGGSFKVYEDNGTSLTNLTGVQTGVSRNGWTYYSIDFAENSSTDIFIMRDAADCYLDEVRLYPASAFMESYTYKPGCGMSTTTDQNDRSKYYEYDSYGRLTLVRDHDKNILKKFKEKYQDSDN